MGGLFLGWSVYQLNGVLDVSKDSFKHTANKFAVLDRETCLSKLLKN